MTFFIVLFIVLMQFLWKHIDDLVGKGLPMSLIGELFFYAAVSMVPMALPLAILLASLMTFGNFGEKFELTAMKASGISLFRAMKPLIAVVILISIGAFYFQNNVLPQAQVKMWTLLFSMRQKSPEVEIPEGVFYDQIPGYNLLVQKKDRETGKLYDVMIYDVTRGGDNATILVADSGNLAFTGDMKYLYLHLHMGEQFENLREQKNMDKNVPFRREEFHEKEILIPFDANFNRLDEGGMRSQYVGKNIVELKHTIDSIGLRLDSTGNIYEKELRGSALPLIFDRRGQLLSEQENFSSGKNQNSRSSTADANEKNHRFITIDDATGLNDQNPVDQTDGKKNTSGQKDLQADGNGQMSQKCAKSPSRNKEAEPETKKVLPPLNMDSLLLAMSPPMRDRVFEGALAKSKREVNDYQFKSLTVEEDKKNIRRHQIEWLKKYTLSVACIIFFFIGAPLGAIIRKGGLGTPLVISVLLFLFYYIIDNAGYKMARDGHWVVWAGIWLSTFVLAPLGVYVTYKAMNDSAVFDADRYKAFLRKLKGETPTRQVRFKEVVINDVNLSTALDLLRKLISDCDIMLEITGRRIRFDDYWRQNFITQMAIRLTATTDEVVEYLEDSRSAEIITLLAEYPLILPKKIWEPTGNPKRPRLVKWLYPLTWVVWKIGKFKIKKLRKETEKTRSVSLRLIDKLQEEN